eukprot:CFRG3538T1
MFSCCFGRRSASANESTGGHAHTTSGGGGSNFVFNNNVNAGIPVTLQHAKFLAMLDAMEQNNYPMPEIFHQRPSALSDQQSESSRRDQDLENENANQSKSVVAKTSLNSKIDTPKASPRNTIQNFQQPEMKEAHIPPEAPG